MILGWPLALLTLATIPVVLGLYLWRERRLRQAPVCHSHIALVRAALGARRRPWTRHLPLAGVLLALLALGVGTARPTVEMTVPQDRTTIMLAIDVSRSMCSIDVDPNRIAAAQSAVREFIDAQPRGTRFMDMQEAETKAQNHCLQVYGSFVKRFFTIEDVVHGVNGSLK